MKDWLATSTYVVPLDDLREHDPDNGECWCRPWYDGDILGQNSADHRELVERTEPDMTEPRFTVRWCRGTGVVLWPGFAVYDHSKRITITWDSFAEACRHRDRIAQIYAENGW